MADLISSYEGPVTFHRWDFMAGDSGLGFEQNYYHFLKSRGVPTSGVFLLHLRADLEYLTDQHHDGTIQVYWKPRAAADRA
jgi:hypothetical protein